MTDLREFVSTSLANLGVADSVSSVIAITLLVLFVLLVCFLVNWIAKRVLLVAIGRFIRRTKTEWDDVLIEKGFFSRLSQLAPAVVIYLAASLFPEFEEFLKNVAVAYMGLIGLLVFGAFLEAVASIYRTFQIARSRPIRGYVQAIKFFVYILGGIAIFGTLIGESPWKLLSGIGALTAIVLLVFKDSILGFVASIQISVNDMVRIGDWIEMSKYGADGDVIEVSIQCVKVQNWDKTITTIPTYALVSDSFKNWRGMQESGGRRVKRSVLIDMTSIRFCTEDDLKRFKTFAFLEGYLEERIKEVGAFNRKMGFDLENKVNGRRLTNIGCFREYLRQYLRSSPKVSQEMTLLVRHLPPGDNGLPVEIYLFSNDTRWAEFEAIQADLFDHILAVIPEFGLRVFQKPSGLDVRDALSTLSSESVSHGPSL